MQFPENWKSWHKDEEIKLLKRELNGKEQYSVLVYGPTITISIDIDTHYANRNNL